MQKKISIKLLPSEAADENIIKQYAADESGVPVSSVSGFTIFKKSIDARSRKVWINLSLHVFINEPPLNRELIAFNFPDVSNSRKSIIIIGAGPAGLFAALQLIALGIKPIIIERGKEVKERRRDLALLNKEGEINPESNYCFGEGGAGTYSDGKLYTRSSKRGDVKHILQLFYHFGAPETILYESHPHIGTNKLPQIIIAIRKRILDCGGEIHFNNKVTDLKLKNEKIAAVKINNDYLINGDAFILATGHSARDIFNLLHSKNIAIEYKPFALGVRVEHPQSLIDNAQYHCSPLHSNNFRYTVEGILRSPNLPPASYSLAHQINGKGVFSFCMCPGGIIAPAATDHGEIVVNGWSPSKRNNPYANSGIVVEVGEKDVQHLNKYGPLAGMHFQQEVEKKAFQSGGCKMVAPAMRLVDFVQEIKSTSLPDCSYLPGVHSASLREVLPKFVYDSLRIALKEFGNKIPGYYSNDAIVIATESRTSSPIRIPRDVTGLQHPQIKNLFPCGEGAGYAGGIVSAAMDGQRVANQAALFLKP